MLQPMTPQANYAITTSTSTGSTTIATNTNQIRFLNNGSALVYYKTGTGTVTATTSDTWLAPGIEVVFSKPPQDTVLALIAASGAPVVLVTVGQGA